MTQAREISDEDLTAFLDGEASDALAQSIAAARVTDADLAQRLDALALDIDALRAATAPSALGAPSMPALPAPAPQRRLWPVAAALALGLTLGALGTALVPRAPAPMNWVEAVAAYQALYIPETVANSEQSPGSQAAVLEQFSQTFALDLTPATTLGKVDFRRAQSLAFEGAPLLQLAYLSETGAPIALCLTKVSGPDRAPTSETLFGMASTHWVANGIGYIAIGGEDTALTRAMADEMIAAL